MLHVGRKWAKELMAMGESTLSKTWQQPIVPYKIVLGKTTKKKSCLRKIFYLKVCGGSIGRTSPERLFEGH